MSTNWQHVAYAAKETQGDQPGQRRIGWHRVSWSQSLRWRLILTFVASGFLAVITTVFLLLLASAMLGLPIIGDLIKFTARTLGSTLTLAVIFVVGLILLFAYYVLLMQPTIRYMEQMSRAMEQVAQGNFDISLPARGPDELGVLGQNMVTMGQQLKASIAKERLANQARYELITSVSHDLRTPLTSILGYLQLIDEDRYKDEIELRYYVDIAYEKGKQLKRLIDQLFEFTRTSPGGITLRPMPINPAELLEQVAEEFVPALRKAEMEYRLSLPPQRATINADPDLLVRVLENLIANAIQYGREGKVVELELELLPAAGLALIRVANRGNRIPEHELPHIFRTFYRVERSRSGKTGGAGLGLAIAKNIVSMHGGSIQAYNQVDRTIFEIRLPMSLGEPSLQGTPAP